MAKNLNQSALDLGQTPDGGKAETDAVPSRRMDKQSGGPSTARYAASAVPGVTLRAISAGDLQLHPRLGCTIDELRHRYADLTKEATARFRRNLPPIGLPRVMVIDGTARLGALTEVPTAIAAIDLAAGGAAIALDVIEGGDFSGEAFVKEMLETSVAKTLWEQANALKFLRAEYGTLREWMRVKELDPEKWDSKCSKIIKLLELPGAIQEKVDLFSIKSLKDSGAVVAMWKDPKKRTALMTILMHEVADRNDRAPAGPLFKKMLAAGSVPTSKAMWQAHGDRKVLVDRRGRTIASMTLYDDGWKLEGDDPLDGDWKTLAAALKDLHR